MHKISELTMAVRSNMAHQIPSAFHLLALRRIIVPSTIHWARFDFVRLGHLQDVRTILMHQCLDVCIGNRAMQVWRA